METNAAIIILAPVFLPVVQAMGVELYILASSWLSTWLLALLPASGRQSVCCRKRSPDDLGQDLQGHCDDYWRYDFGLMLFAYLEPIVMFLLRFVYGG